MSINIFPNVLPGPKVFLVIKVISEFQLSSNFYLLIMTYSNKLLYWASNRSQLHILFILIFAWYDFICQMFAWKLSISLGFRCTFYKQLKAIYYLLLISPETLYFILYIGPFTDTFEFYHLILGIFPHFFHTFLPAFSRLNIILVFSSIY